MATINKIPHVTWRFTKANSVDIELSGVEYKNYPLNNIVESKIPEEFSNNFKGKKYGLSDEVLKLNEELRNLEEYHLFNDGDNISREVILDKENNIINDTHALHIRKDMKASIIFDYKSLEESDSFRNSVYKIKAEENSFLKIVLIQRLSEKSRSLVSLITDIEESARVEIVQVELGSNESYSNYKINLNGNHAESDIQTAYFVDGSRYLDLGYEMTHTGRETNSNMVVHGVLKDYAKKRFAGTLDFLKGCTLSTGNEEEFVTLLDPTVKSIAVPLLLAREDDIVGNHAASAGRIDKDMLFYITTRGFDPLAAKRIIVESKLKPIFDMIGDEKISEELLVNLRKGIN